MTAVVSGPSGSPAEARRPAEVAPWPRTHEVANQPPPLVGHDVTVGDAALREGLARHGAGWYADDLARLARRVGSAEVQQWAAEADAAPPRLVTHDRYGHRVDEVAYHPSYHRLMETSVGAGLHCLPWRDTRPGAHVARAAGFYAMTQGEAAHGCPVSMTYAALPALRATPEVAAEWEPRLTSLTYDPRPVAPQDKAGALAGMSMTEKQGGSDVRAGTTRAAPAGGPGEYALVGHKWFTSAPMGDVFLVLAQAPGGLSCLAVPRVLPDGTRNAVRLQRLKDKLGNRANASSEIEYEGAWARLVGEEGRGVRTILEMVALTRLDCVIGSAAGMRAALAQAVHHARHRAAFGRLLADQPLMRVVLADLAVESEAATTLMLRLAAAVDGAAGDAHEARVKRLGVAVGKYWVCKRAAPVVAEALECLGGNGYVEESGMPRLYREAPLNSIWEGSGNVNALDVLRAVERDPASLEALLAEVDVVRGRDARLDAAAAALRADLADPAGLPARARRVVERLALVWQGALLLAAGDTAAPVAEAFCAGRLDPGWSGGGLALGTLPPGVDVDGVLARAG